MSSRLEWSSKHYMVFSIGILLSNMTVCILFSSIIDCKPVINNWKITENPKPGRFGFRFFSFFSFFPVIAKPVPSSKMFLCAEGWRLRPLNVHVLNEERREHEERATFVLKNPWKYMSTRDWLSNEVKGGVGAVEWRALGVGGRKSEN